MVQKQNIFTSFLKMLQSIADIYLKTFHLMREKKCANKET